LAITTFLRALWRAITVNRKVMAGSAIVVVFALVAIFGPLIIHQNPLTYTKDLVQPPSPAHWLGTNQGGQDVFIQLVVGTRSSLAWAFVTGLMVMVIAITVGLVSGYAGGIVDDILSVITNVFLVVPAFPLAIIAVQYFNRSTVTIAIIVALTNWPWGARVLRAQTLSMRSREFVTSRYCQTKSPSSPPALSPRQSRYYLRWLGWSFSALATVRQ
jgi:peptide/nickel transport system permease protein